MKYSQPQLKEIQIRGLKDFRSAMRELQLVPNFMSEYKVAQAYQFFGEQVLGVEDFIKICYTALASNSTINDIFTHLDLSQHEKNVLEELKAR